MKNKIHLLWNPFTRIAGWQAFAAGLAVFVIAAVVAAYGNLAFDGAVDAHFGEGITVQKSFVMSAISLLSVVIFMYAGGLLLTRSFRFQDILGTMTLARFPFLILAVTSLFSKFPDAEEIIGNPMLLLSYPSFIVFTIIAIPVMVWVIALHYNAFRISVGVKGAKLTVVFIAALLLGEVLSKVLIHFMI